MNKKVALDVDECIANWLGHFLDMMKLRGVLTERDLDAAILDWHDERVRDNFHRIANDLNFWKTIPPLIDPDSLGFEPIAYITSRPIETRHTRHWIEANGFPMAPVYTVGQEASSKAEALHATKPDIFADDNYNNWKEATDEGFFTFLINKGHNERFDVPDEKRIDCVTEIKNRI